MDKSMYSLILMDEVVHKIDALAHTNGTSRSNLINQILADYASVLTPQKRTHEIFEHLSGAVRKSGKFQIRRNSPSVLLLRSALNYRYNPTISYRVEIALDDGHYTCELKVSSRTKSSGMLAGLNVFFELWSQIEHSTLDGGQQGKPSSFSITDGSFRRRLKIERDGKIYGSELLGKSIGAYIRLFNKALCLCFSAEHGVDMQTYEQMNTLYRRHMDEFDIIL